MAIFPPRTGHKWKRKEIEVINYFEVSTILSERYGMDTQRVVNDWNGMDFIMYDMITSDIYSVQLKSRITIAKKYTRSKDLYITFPIKKNWYFIKHQDLVKLFDLHLSSYKATTSWTVAGIYHTVAGNSGLRSALIPYML